jgi:uncharacterized protein (DUF2267 family)
MKIKKTEPTPTQDPKKIPLSVQDFARRVQNIKTVENNKKVNSAFDEALKKSQATQSTKE